MEIFSCYFGSGWPVYIIRYESGPSPPPIDFPENIPVLPAEGTHEKLASPTTYLQAGECGGYCSRWLAGTAQSALEATEQKTLVWSLLCTLWVASDQP